jgi:DNA repair exonuclease SbcCD ATPase subunit
MYLEEIEVQNWRGIRHQQLRLEPGLNIIHGPNESGKSSLRQAIRAAFLQNPTSKTRETLAAKSWGGGTAPFVRVDFQLGGDSWRVEKRFFSNKGSRLSRNGILIATDGDVHKRLETLLSQAVWLGSLWSEQGDTRLPEVPRALRGKLVAEEVVSPGLLWLEDQLKRLEGEYWTPTGRPKGTLQQARQRVADADDAVYEAERELQETDTISQAMGELQEELQQSRAEEAAVAEQLADLRQKVGAWDRYRAEKAQSDKQVEILLNQAQWLQRWERHADQLVSKWNELQQHQAILASFEKESLQEPTRDAVDAARARMEYAARLAQQKLHVALGKLNPATPQQLSRLRQLENELARCEATLESISMKLSLTALSALKPAVQIDEEPRSTDSLSSGETRRWEAHKQARIILPGVAELTLEGGASDAAETATRRDQLRLDLSTLLESLACKTVEQAQEMADKARALQALVEGKPPTEAELARLAEAAGDVSTFERWTPEKLREKARSLRSDLDEAEAQWNTANRAYQAQRTQREALARANPQAALELHHEQLANELERWPLEEGAPPLPPVDELKAEWIARLESGALTRALRTRLEREQTRLEKERANLRPPEGDEVTPETIAAAEAQQHQLARQRENLTNRLNQELGRLRERSDQYQKLVELREQQAALQAETNQSELQAAAIQRLNQAFQQARSQLQSDLVGPLQQRVAGRLKLFTGDRYRGLKLDDRLSPVGVIPREVDSAALTDLSFGTQEQLMFLTRLCLAEMLSEKHQRQCLVFDDNLVNTDRDRMAVALQLLTEAAEKSQIVLLTCHPERYECDTGAAAHLRLLSMV